MLTRLTEAMTFQNLLTLSISIFIKKSVLFCTKKDTFTSTNALFSKLKLSTSLFLILIPTCLITSSCSTIIKVGYLYNNSDKVQPLKANNAEDEFKITRDAFSNAFNIKISERKSNDAINSMDIESFQMIFELSSNNDITKFQKVTVFSPLFYSSNIKLDTSWVIPNLSKVLFSIHCNELGKNIVLSSLISPSGIRGVLIFDDNKAYSFRGNLIEKNSLVGIIYLKKGMFRKCYLIESLVEYPIKITTKYDSDYLCKIKSNTKTILPWSNVKVKLTKNAKCKSDLGKVNFTKYLLYNSKIKFKQ